MNYVKLEKVICDTIKEQQIKLGYEKETIRLYYPMSSLANILEEETTDSKLMDQYLAEFAKRSSDKLGTIQISHKADRYCIAIPPDGTSYVHENYPDNPFLEALIQVVRKHDSTLEQLLKVFRSFSEHVCCEKSEIDEFDYVIYFTQDTMDDYRYCIKFDEGHTVYHRFLQKDYENLMAES